MRGSSKILLLGMVLLSRFAQAQVVDSNSVSSDHAQHAVPEKDVIDLVLPIFGTSVAHRADTGDGVLYKKAHLSVIPALGYTLQTGVAAVLAGNLVFYTNKSKNENASSIIASVTYSQYNQVIVPVLASIWTPNNKFNITLDYRFMQYPSLTYGIGDNTMESDGYSIDYNLIHLNQTFFVNLSHNFYVGLGYRYDHYWNVEEIDPPPGKPTDFEIYGLYRTANASGPTLNFLYDSRKNSINPLGGAYINMSYWPSLTALGSDANFQALSVDMRKFIRLSKNNDNVLALWTYNWFTLNGTPPYLLLPSTGSDPANNSGRGYIQGRFRDNNMIYFESEYRFNITRNKLFGGVVFANAQSFSDANSYNFGTLIPGYGLGLRLKVNKFSRTNIALDYGFGQNGSGGFFVNLGEVF